MDGRFAKRSRREFSASLFERAQADREDVRTRVVEFARAVARRHRAARRPDREQMLAALRGYYRSWAICSPNRLPVLDDEALALAVAAYTEACDQRRRPPAA